MTEMMIDFRCPACNQPVIGTVEVDFRKRVPTVTKCKHCKSAIFWSSRPGDLSSRYAKSKRRKP